MDEIDKYRVLVNRYLDKPTHISYIKNYIFKCDDLAVKKLIDTFVEEGLIESHPKFKEYYGKR